jgi:hypothetical protein
MVYTSPSRSRNASRHGSPPRFGSTSYRPDEPESLDSDLHPVVHEGRVAVITGAASGIGRAAALEFAK